MEMIQYLNPDGQSNADAVKSITAEQQLEMYRDMVFLRVWNDKVLSLQRQGRMGTVGSVRGQEAANVGMGYALTASDWFLPSFREFGTMFKLGVDPKNQMLQWGGYEAGQAIPENVKMTPISITVGSHLNHAVGVALAAKLKGEKSAAVSCSGDGSSSQGGFHEALNLAAVYQAPVVFVIQNNGWAISLPFEKQTVTKTIAEKAAAHGLDGVYVDGNDIFAVYLTIQKYVERAREKNKPALIELRTYRMGDHTTADDATRYRTAEEVTEWGGKDPILRLRRHLEATHGWTVEQEQQLIEASQERMNSLVQAYENTDVQPPADIFNYMYQDLPWHLREQQQEVIQMTEGGE